MLSGRSTDYEYDSLGRLIRAEQYITATGVSLLKTENKYDAYGRASSSKYQLNGKTQEYEITYKPNSSLISTFSAAIAANQNTITEFDYDSLDRLASKITHVGAFSKTESYEYLTDGTDTTSFVSAYTVDGVRYTYTYNKVGNITEVRKNGALKYSYAYDKLGQLTEAVIYSDTYSTDYIADIYAYTYDKSGNITSVTYTYGANANNVDTVQYGYGNTSWGDLLTSFGGTNITYDAIGNPLKWRNAFMLEWQGRNLINFANTNGEIYNYAYNADGIRTQKNVYDADGRFSGSTEYIYDGTKLIAENRSGDWLYYFYDENGTVSGISYGGTLYYFRKNLQGDVTGIYNAYGNIIAQYEYTPYGALLAITDANGNDISTNADHIANINPFRYRGYYYDTETELYYLITRYYDPVVGRFLNADRVISGVGGSIQGYNMFAYCFNNPVNMSDSTGHWPQWIKNAANWVNNNIIQPIVNFFSPSTNTISGEFQDGKFRGSGSLTGGYSEFNWRLDDKIKSSGSQDGWVGGFGKASVGNANGKIGVGNDNLSASLKGVVDGLVATAQAGLHYKDGFGVGTKAKASVLSGRATTEFNIFGWEVELGVSGDVLSVGAEATIGIFSTDDGGKQFDVGYNIGAGWFGWGYVVRVKAPV